MVKLIAGRPYRGKLQLEMAFDMRHGRMDGDEKGISNIKEGTAVGLWGLLIEDAYGNPLVDHDCRTSYVVGLTAHMGQLYAITRNSVYQIVGDNAPAIVNEDLLRPLWEGLKARIESGEQGFVIEDPVVEHTFHKYPSTAQFRNTLNSLRLRAAYQGRDEGGEPIYGDVPEDTPSIQYIGTAKAHGTNGSFCQYADGSIAFFSKGRKLEIGDDNKNFAGFFTERMEAVEELFTQARFYAMKDGKEVQYPIIISGEWMGKGVQKGAAVGDLDKLFMIIGIAFGTYVGKDGEEHLNWYPGLEMKKVRDPAARIFNAFDFGYFTETLDVVNPEPVAERLEEITRKVEIECPIAAYFGIEGGTGEGIVWKPLDPELAKDTKLWFKTKGDKHSSSKGAKLVSVDVEKQSSVNEFVDYALTRSRLDQALAEVYGDGPVILGPKVGDFMKWLNADIYKEEYDTLEASGLTMKDVNKRISAVAKTYLFAMMK